MQKTKCTIIVPLKNNPRRTKQFLRESIHDNFEYIFADGSTDAENEVLFKHITRPNIRYFRSSPDISRENFYKKMVLAVSMVSTPYVISVDQGDIPLVNGILRCCQELEKSKDHKAASGNVFFARVFGTLMTKPYQMENTDNISEVSLLTALKNLENTYTYIWYSVFEKSIYQGLWNEILNQDFTHPYLEYFPTLYTLNHSPHLHLEIPMLIRKIYGPRNWTKHSDDLMPGDLSTLSVDQRTKDFASKTAAQFGVEEKLIFKAYFMNAREVQLPYKFVNNYGLKILKINKIAPIVFNYFYPQRILRVFAHYSKLILPPNTFGQYNSFLTWRKTSFQVKKLNQAFSNKSKCENDTSTRFPTNGS